MGMASQIGSYTIPCLRAAECLSALFGGVDCWSALGSIVIHLGQRPRERERPGGAVG